MSIQKRNKENKEIKIERNNFKNSLNTQDIDLTNVWAFLRHIVLISWTLVCFPENHRNYTEEVYSYEYASAIRQPEDNTEDSAENLLNTDALPGLTGVQMVLCHCLKEIVLTRFRLS